MRIPIIAFIWGLLEATCFFIVPDILLTFIVIKNPKQAFRASFFVLIGALVGGSFIYWLSLKYFSEVSQFFNHLPAINPTMQAVVRESIEHSGLKALFLGPLKGIPYKLYASQSANLGISFVLFILVSIPARWLRFVLVTLVTYLVAMRLKKWFSDNTIYIITSCSWIIFYAVYFIHFSK